MTWSIGSCISFVSYGGTPFDLFGYDQVRRVERDLIVQYRRLIFAAVETLDADSHARAVELAELPRLIRGYDSVKLGNVKRFWNAVRALGFEPSSQH